MYIQDGNIQQHIMYIHDGNVQQQIMHIYDEKFAAGCSRHKYA
jgi:hypothetical protein